MNTKLKKGALEKEPAFKYTLLASEKLKLNPAGFNFNFSDASNVYLNAGSFSRAPFFNFVFTNYQNVVVDPLENEKARSVEFGYGFKSNKFSAENLFDLNPYPNSTDLAFSFSNGSTTTFW